MLPVRGIASVSGRAFPGHNDTATRMDYGDFANSYCHIKKLRRSDPQDPPNNHKSHTEQHGPSQNKTRARRPPNASLCIRGLFRGCRGA
ncbi:protein of unknown function [Candidatus Methylomirabilis oxygeniifera]|uniref:Uncharacterized protein n=1 Tax=Methylomirabilis oxygeniifera TaxID=671143 RepID=D5MJ97_METO1|nr:protein of unknown function [Candidatus Methylomirabilis oxyfera]